MLAQVSELARIKYDVSRREGDNVQKTTLTLCRLQGWHHVLTNGRNKMVVARVVFGRTF